MKRSLFLLICASVALLIPYVAAAQGYPGYNPYSGLPPKVFPRGPDMVMGGNHPGAPPPCGPPMCMPMMPACKGERLLGPTSFYAGYLTYWDGVINRFDYLNTQLLSDLKTSYALNGIVLGAAQQVPMGEAVQLLFKGSWFIPLGVGNQNYTANEIYSFFPGQRTWTVDPQWWNLDASAAYMVAPSAAAIAGFRLDSFQTVFKTPTATFISSPNDRADIGLMSYIPYLGVLAGVSTCESSTSGSVVGFPAVFGSVTYSENMAATGNHIQVWGPLNAFSGYFFEASVEHARIGPTATLAVFAKWTMLEAQGRPQYEVATAGAATVSDNYTFCHERKAFTIGARVQIDFGSLR